MDSFDEKILRKNLLIDAKAVGIPIGSAEIFVDKTITETKKAIKHKKIITNHDLERIITKELKKYNADLAYVQTIRDKII